MSHDVLFMFTLGILALGVSLTMHFRRQADKKAFDTLWTYLLPTEGDLLEQIRSTVRRGIRLLEKLEGVATIADRNAVREKLTHYAEMVTLERLVPPRLPRMSIAPCRAKDWWTEFEMEWQTLRTHVTKTLPASRRHALRQ